MSLGICTAPPVGGKKIDDGRERSPLLGKKLSPDVCAKMSAARTGVKKPPWVRELIRQGQRRAWARRKAVAKALS